MRKIFHHLIEKGLERRKIFEAREWQKDESLGVYCYNTIILKSQVLVPDDEIIDYLSD